MRRKSKGRGKKDSRERPPDEGKRERGSEREESWPKGESKSVIREREDRVGQIEERTRRERRIELAKWGIGRGKRELAR